MHSMLQLLLDLLKIIRKGGIILFSMLPKML